MLQALYEFHGIESGAYLLAVRGLVAADAPLVDHKPSGAYLIRTNGNPRGGYGRKYVLLTTSDHNSPEFKRKRFTAADEKDAIRIANATLQRWQSGCGR